MGLAEKRSATEFQEKVFPEWKSKIEGAVGGPLEMEIRWETMSVANQGANYAAWWPKVYFQPLAEALAEIGKDQMGKDALKGGLKKVIIDGSKGHSPSTFSFSGGVLSIYHEADANVADIDARRKGIVKLIESAL